MDRLLEAKALEIDALDNPPPPTQLAAPLDYIFADHFRHRTLCGVLDRIADATQPDRELTAAALRFLKSDFARHVRDEEEDLFPLLRRRAAPEDRIDDILGELCQEHAADKLDGDKIVTGLTAIVSGGKNKKISKLFGKFLKRFAANERRHLIVENAIVLPLARARLTPNDLQHLRRRMARRRGYDPEAITRHDG